LCILTITSGTLAFGDPCYFPQFRAQIEVKPGRYRVQAKVRDFATGRRVSALRALADGGSVFDLTEVKDFAVDAGMAAVCDFNTFKEAHALAKNADEDFAFLSYFHDQFGVVKLGTPPADMAYVVSGWGDGIYTVYAYLDEQGKPIGGEVVFIEDELDLMEAVEEYQIITRAELEQKAKQRRADDEADSENE
jgi:hypothetical protein